MDKFITAFPISKSEDVRFHLRELRGSRMVDVRVYSALKPGDEKLPTGKGVTVPVARFENLKQALLATEHSLEENRPPS